MNPSQNNNVLLVCDLNVFVQAYLFNCGVLLEGRDYSFGQLLIHETVYNEILIWPKSNLKIKKFGLPLIQSMLKKCGELAVPTPIVPDAEKEKLFRRISKAEESLDTTERSQATSKADKMYLAIAIKSKGNIATHEASLRSITKKTIGENHLFSLGRMIEDRNRHGLLKKQDILDGIANLKHYNENLMKEDQQIVQKLLAA